MHNNFVFLPLTGGLLNLEFSTKIPTRFHVNGLEFLQIGEDFNGFYDWLRNDQSVVGVRYDIFEGTDALRQELRLSENVNILKDVEGSDLKFEVFFFADTEYLSKRSDDQAFCDDHLYRAKTGEFGFTFGLNDDREYADLKYRCERLRSR